MAVVRRHDRQVLIALVVLGVLWLFFMSLFTGFSGGGVTIGS